MSRDFPTCMNLIFFGAPGVGKGTQATLLAERLDLPHISTGAIFRGAIDSGQILGLRVKEYLDQGLLVPDELTSEIALATLAENRCNHGFILDGYPRNLRQAEDLNAAMRERRRTIDRVVHLVVPQQEVIDRMLGRGRVDDTEAVIRRRLAVYDAETAPVLGFYRELHIVAEVNGLGTVDEVQERILEAIGYQPTT